eukprot:CAMPEP_0178939274 /NCGR_PEP_ID=MMETSP0789-20121207/115_1 /TAXON_ID=3005 /ORGANISM="Rhizosolenia setigera, Strain CCMP 1694" /LENGTH=407 /DNA_ID=CAMNT_0020618089 /DNA_START=57 /DNA_END=1280 /DNA_ORIENTATION=-
MSFTQGSFVKLHGLANAKHYNGLTAVVIGDMKDGRIPVQLLDHQEGWNESQPDPKKECAGKTLNAKKTNLKSSDDSKYWKIEQMQNPMSVYDLTTRTNIGFEFDCSIYVRRVWDTFFETVPPQPLDDDHVSLLLDEKGHILYWLRCDAIMFHMMIEKCRGRFRIFQSFVDDPMSPGYSGREWCGTNPPEGLLKNSNWKKYGRGLTVSREEVEYLLKTIIQMQRMIPSLLPYLLENVPGITSEDIKILQDGAGKARRDNRVFNRAFEVLEICRRWSADAVSKLGPLGITEIGVQNNAATGTIFYGEVACISQGNRRLFQIPRRVYERVHELMSRLTCRNIISPVVFLKILNTGLWWKDNADPDTGGAIGFAYHAARLDLHQSEEEGIKNAEALRKKYKDRLKAMRKSR